MSEAPRYAVYYCPAAQSELAQFGASVLGYDAATGCEVEIAAPLIPDFPDWRLRVAEPARYGFHATLKAPFSLSAGATEADLLNAVEAVAGTLDGLELGNLQVSAIESFVALVPSTADAARSLAQAIVERLDHLRAPLGAADRARRLNSALTPRQIELLDRWGYPYSAEQFRFHMTLTGPLEAVEAKRARAVLANLYRPLDAPLTLEAIAVFKQPAPAQPFRILQRLELRRGACGSAR